MKRRVFIEKSLLSTIALSLGSSSLLSCREHLILPDAGFSGKVIIIGAGVAGLYAGYLLKSKGVDFTILEATSVAGGRVAKKTNFADFDIDLGAQWLHGLNSILGDLAVKTKTIISEDNSTNVFWYQEQLVTSLPINVGEIVSPSNRKPDISYADYASQQGLGDEYKYIVEQLAGDLGADSSDLSIKWTGTYEDEWSSGDDDYKFENSFFDLIDQHITSELDGFIQFDTVVEEIDYRNETITVIDRLGKNLAADKVIITVPITILQDGDITFIPDLPSEKIEAFGKIGMGAGMKVFLKFQEKFYNENIAGGEVCAAYADDSVGKKGTDHVLLAFVMGKQAENLTTLGADELIAQALITELDGMYDGAASANILAWHVVNWTTSPFVRGAYSYDKVGIGNARTIAAEPVEDKLYFAGEAMNLNGHHQSVHGAIETGYKEVIRILKPDAL
ncbi:MAG: NAD(P)/FAD-dependent oxidoreductase [Cyclobacteriaceae bacterium]